MTSNQNPNHKGNVAEMAIAAAATKLGIDVSKPLVEHARYDLIFDIVGRLLRVQCKWAAPDRRCCPGALLLQSSRARRIHPDRVSRWRDRCGSRLLPRQRSLLHALGRRCHRPLRRPLAPRSSTKRASGRSKMGLGIRAWGCSSVGRAPAWHAGGHGFKSRQLHSSQRRGWSDQRRCLPSAPGPVCRARRRRRALPGHPPRQALRSPGPGDRPARAPSRGRRQVRGGADRPLASPP